jgi:hypothetical protein
MRCDGDNHRAEPRVTRSIIDASSIRSSIYASQDPSHLTCDPIWEGMGFLLAEKSEECGGWRTNGHGGQGSVRAHATVARVVVVHIQSPLGDTRVASRPWLCAAYVATTSISPLLIVADRLPLKIPNSFHAHGIGMYQLHSEQGEGGSRGGCEEDASSFVIVPQSR